MENKVASALGLSEEDVQAVPALIVADSFFTKLAELGEAVETDEEKAALWEMKLRLDDLENKTAEHHSSNRLNSGLAVLQGIYGEDPGENKQAEYDASLSTESAEKAAMYLQNPTLFGHGLALAMQGYNDRLD